VISAGPSSVVTVTVCLVFSSRGDCSDGVCGVLLGGVPVDESAGGVVLTLSLPPQAAVPPMTRVTTAAMLAILCFMAVFFVNRLLTRVPIVHPVQKGRTPRKQWYDVTGELTEAQRFDLDR
jgi:hypothetical protein